MLNVMIEIVDDALGGPKYDPTINWHPKYFGVYFFDETNQKRFKMVTSCTKNTKNRVCQSQVCCLHITHLGPLNVKISH